VVYYNENDPRLTPWLYELMAAGVIAPGFVDTRSIEDVTPDGLREFKQCHFFAGIGVWSYALRLAGWPDDRHVWTGSCPCQPFSAAGKGAGFDDKRHLWPAWHWLISQCRPRVIFGEQVASNDGLGWLDLVQTDLEVEGYAVGPVDLCAAGVGAPHIRQRLWFVADAEAGRREAGCRSSDAGEHGADAVGRSAGGLADAERTRLQARPDADLRRALGHDEGRQPGQSGERRRPWSTVDWVQCRDGKARPIEPGTFPLSHGTPGRVWQLRAYGNAIVPQVAAAVIDAYLS
jgi:DNA (cytosine-5)-methyltransferase 1